MFINSIRMLFVVLFSLSPFCEILPYVIESNSGQFLCI